LEKVQGKIKMSNKDWDKIWDADKYIRKLFPANPLTAPGSEKTVLATIEIVGGFEAFNTRPYHNYEDWGQGYRVSSQGIAVEAEDLDDALALWEKQKGALQNIYKVPETTDGK